jgi:hypothetical protein
LATAGFFSTIQCSPLSHGRIRILGRKFATDVKTRTKRPPTPLAMAGPGLVETARLETLFD